MLFAAPFYLNRCEDLHPLSFASRALHLVSYSTLLQPLHTDGNHSAGRGRLPKLTLTVNLALQLLLQRLNRRTYKTCDPQLRATHLDDCANLNCVDQYAQGLYNKCYTKNIHTSLGFAREEPYLFCRMPRCRVMDVFSMCPPLPSYTITVRRQHYTSSTVSVLDERVSKMANPLSCTTPPKDCLPLSSG